MSTSISFMYAVAGVILIIYGGVQICFNKGLRIQNEDIYIEESTKLYRKIMGTLAAIYGILLCVYAGLEWKAILNFSERQRFFILGILGCVGVLINMLALSRVLKKK